MTEALEHQVQLLRQIDRSLDNFKKIGKNNYTAAKIRNRLSALKELWAQVQTGHAKLRCTVSMESQKTIEYFKDNHFEVCEELYLRTSDYMSECLEEVEPIVSPNTSTNLENSSTSSSSAFSVSHLPPISLPPFDGKFEEWESFRDRFTSLIIQNKELKDFARMHFLTSSLTGRALECVRNLPVTADNFKIAWDTLKSRFECKRRLINVHLTSLLNLPVIQRESALDLQGLRDKTNATRAALTNLKRSPEELWNDMLVCLVSQKLDPVTRKAWKLKINDATTVPSYKSLDDFLDTRVRALEEWKPPLSAPEKSTKSSHAQKITSATANAKAPLQCSLCKSNHLLHACPQFAKKSTSQRRDFVKQDGCCFNCLSKGHAIQTCASKYTCRQCKKKRHTLLHDDSSSSFQLDDVTSSSQSEKSAEIKSAEVNSLCASTRQPRRSHVLLATAQVTVSAPSGRSVSVRALLDQGSEMTFITEKLAQSLLLKRLRMPISISAVGGIKVGTCRHAAHMTISPRNASTPRFSTTALILNTLTSYSPKRVLADSVLSQFRDLSWADDDPMSSEPIDILLGADLYGDLILEGIAKSTVGRPIAQNTVLGWVISGPTADSGASIHAHSLSSGSDRACDQISFLHCFGDQSLDRELQKFWEVEEIPRRGFMSPEDERCEDHFRATHSRQPDGRYVVRLPFKTNPPINIGESRSRAKSCLAHLLRRLQARSEHKKEYSEFLQEYLTLGHMQNADHLTSPNAQCVFIPHHHVIREDSATTHLRVVFNASSPTTNGSSLNDHLLAGPKLQNDLPSIILKWRLFQYVYTADITKMYRQIRVDTRDVDYQRILWTTSESDQPSEFRLLTITYGTACAPFLALRVLKQLVDDEGRDFPLAVNVLHDQIYVDDVLFGDSDPHRLRLIRDQLRELLQRGGFELRKWASNTPSLLSDISPDNHGLACQKTLQPDKNLKVLGIGWTPASDVFRYTVSLPPVIPRSKRLILSTIAKLFDPLGWVTPVTIKAKIFLQYLWRLKLNWDDELPTEHVPKWTAIYSQLTALNKLDLPRWMGTDAHASQYEIHGFSDASSAAYAAVVYLKTISDSDQTMISLVMGKSKVALIKPMSIPRLELAAAVLLSKLIQYVQKALQISTINSYCWTHSTVVLAWLQQHPSRWKTFVANRVHEIQSNLPTTMWRHVPTLDNPADCASRGVLGDDLVTHALWWNGPPWLKLSCDHWPPPTCATHSDSELEQKVTSHSAHPKFEWDLQAKFSSWHTLIRVTAYVMRFVTLCRRKTDPVTPRQTTGIALHADECQAARVFWSAIFKPMCFSKNLEP